MIHHWIIHDNYNFGTGLGVNHCLVPFLIHDNPVPIFRSTLPFLCWRSKGRLKFSLPSQLCEFQTSRWRWMRPSSHPWRDSWTLKFRRGSTVEKCGFVAEKNWSTSSWDYLKKHLTYGQISELIYIYIHIYILRRNSQKRIEQWFTTIFAGFYFSIFWGLAGC